jgi:hypothetical protein
MINSQKHNGELSAWSWEPSHNLTVSLVCRIIVSLEILSRGHVKSDVFNKAARTIDIIHICEALAYLCLYTSCNTMLSMQKKKEHLLIRVLFSQYPS